MTRVLLVDDDDDIRMLVRIMLTLAGFTIVAESEDGSEAIHKASELKPDVVILDVRMPRMTGDLAAMRIREASPASAIVAFSAHLDAPPPWADEWLSKDAIGRLPNLIDGLSLKKEEA